MAEYSAEKGAEFRAALEAACLEGLHLTEWGPRYSPSDGADAVERLLATHTLPPVECEHPGIEHGTFSYTGTCPTCRKCKFIGHGPLCVDCHTAPPASALETP